MEKLVDFVIICGLVLWIVIYKLFNISFDSIVTGVILGILLVISLLVLKFHKDDDKTKNT